MDPKTDLLLSIFNHSILPAVLTRTATAPLDRVKLLLQTQNVASVRGLLPPGAINCLKRILVEEGFRSLWRGNVANVLRAFPTVAAKLAFDKRRFFIGFPRYRKGSLEYALLEFVKSGIIGLVPLPLVYPFEYARTRLAADGPKRQFKGYGDVLSRTVSNGFMGLYKGAGVSLLGTTITSNFFRAGLLFPTYDSLMVLNPYRRETGLLGGLSKFAIAQIVSFNVMFAGYPFDTISRTLMMQADVPLQQRPYRSALHCCRSIINTQGVIGLFNGAGVNAIRCCSSAFVLVLYGMVKDSVWYDSL